MGMAAAQAKLLSLTARRSDINYQLSSLMRGKLDLMTQASNAADALSAAQRNNNIFVMTTSDNQQTQLSFNSLSKEGLTIVDAKGRTIVPSSYRGNVKGLANVLPASHPAVKSYDGDFVPKTKLTKNYVSIPENTIPMFAETDPENREQKTVKAAKSEPTVQTKYKEQDTIYNDLCNIGTVDGIYEYLNANYKNYTMIIGKKGNSDNWFKENTSDIDKDYAQSFTFGETFQNDFVTAFNNTFSSEFGDPYSNDRNKSLGCTGYTAYDKRKFQYTPQTNIRMRKRFGTDWSNNLTYVSNAEQFITALLKDATVDQNVLKSEAKIMLLNDIDLDDMLEKNDKGGLKEFIQNEISTLNLKDGKEDQIKAYNTALDNFINLTKVDTSVKKNADDEHSAIRKSLTTNLSTTFYNLAKAYGLNSIVSGLSVDADLISNKGFNDNCVINKLASTPVNDTMPENQRKLITMAQDAQKILAMEQKYKLQDGNISLQSEKTQIEFNDGSTMSKDDLNDWDKIAERLQAAATTAAAVGGTESKSGIDASVLAHIYSKYFSCGTNDKFNEDFTNFIQIDDFTGAIGGGGFAINNLKMDATNGQFAGMFGGVTDAVLDGIWMENAQVLSSENGKDPNKQNAAILAHNVSGKTFINVSAKGQQFTINDRLNYEGNKFNAENFLGMAKDGCKLTEKNYNKQPWWSCSRSDYVNAGWSIVNNDNRANKYIKDTYSNEYKIGLDSGYVNTGYSFDSYNTYAGGDYSTKHEGWRSVAMDTDRGNGGGKGSNQRLISSSSGNNVGDGFSAFDVRYEQNLSNICVTQKDVVDKTVETSAIKAIFQNAKQHNSKIKIYLKEDVKSYTEPKDDAWKNGAKFDDGTVVDWQDWDVVDGFNSETGEYTLVKKHGEETEEYLQIKDLLEFYKEQNVRVEYDENRETGCFTYSASGYSIDVEYKEDLNKYLSDNYLYKVENNDSSIVVYERDKVVDIDSSQLVFVDDIEAVLDKNIKNGVWFVQGASVSDASKYERKSLDEIGISETTDEKADAVAQAEYDRKIREIEIQEEKYDAQITELESTLKGIEQEIENQEKIVKQNIQSSFSTFSS